MLDRRDFLKHSMAVAAIAPAGVVTANVDATAIAATRPRNGIRFVVVDEDFEDSVAFADELIAHGAKVFSVQQDLGRLWFGELGAAFSAGKSIAGLTSHSEFHICSSFARAHGASVRYEGEHDCRGSEILTHSILMNEEAPILLSKIVAADIHWPRALAAQLAATSCSDTSCRETTQTQTRRSATHPGSLFSWMIA
ncbi:MAG TPA: twin-arginine translocation signal domain-containing protein [Steroidobacteraceae bacterium]|nr:twin-arginine translocation signal domain-containing protein [Steroidobacteraceae bacterium]